MHRRTTVVGHFQEFILVQDRSGREQTVKSPTGGQENVGGSAGKVSATGGQKRRSVVGNWRVDRPTGTRRTGGQADEGSITGSQAGGSGGGDRGADRPTGTGRRAGGQTGRVECTKSIGSCRKALNETRDILARTE